MGSIEVLEPAIPEHLRVERTIPSKLPPNYHPPFPAYSARFPKDAKGMVTAIIGVQHKSPGQSSQSAAFKKVISFVEQPNNDSNPRYWESAAVTDNRDYYNEVAIPYWTTREDFESWRTTSGFEAWWQSLQPDGETGYFLEVFLPTIDRFETVFSDNNEPEGVAHMRIGVSGQLQEHVYWGSMRDRLPASQTDPLTGEKATIRSSATAANGNDTNTLHKRILVQGRQNLAIIRSGQDWSNTSPHERTLYLTTMHPVLTAGMTFLRDQGPEVGCISCRFMDVIHKSSLPSSLTSTTSTTTTSTDKTFGLAYFDDLSSLEDWSKRHKTHLDIFGRFLQYAGELQGNVSLRLFHEVMVVKPEQQFFEYVGCHDTTGMLASVVE